MNPLPVDYTVRIRRYEPTDPRLGRHVRHDSRSLLFQAPPADPYTLISTQHRSNIPVLDQGQIGSCTGNSATKALSYADLWGSVTNQGTLGSSVGHAMAALLHPRDVLSITDDVADEAYAVGVYSDATKIDPWDGSYPPVDTGSDGLSVAKVLKGRGLISGYTHATSLSAVLGALMDRAVITGTKWLDGMFTPTAAGELVPSGGEAGGHEYVLDGVDMERKRIWMQNSWGRGWGQQGRAWMSFDAYEGLLHDDGDATVFIPNVEPAPVPEPVEPVDVASVFVAVGDSWARVPRIRRDNRRMRAAYQTWRAAGGPGVK